MPPDANTSCIFLVHASFDPELTARDITAATAGDGVPIRWLYLGRDYLVTRTWERGLGAGFQRWHYAQTLQETGKKLREAYIAWVAALSERHHGLLWWSSCFAEKNTYQYSLFHDFCYLEVSRRLAGSAVGPVLVIAENAALLMTIACEPSLRPRVVWVRRPSPWKDSALWAMRMGYVWAREGVRWVGAQLAAQKSRKGSGFVSSATDKKRVLLHTCIDDSYFGLDGQPRDRYFSVLPEELRLRGYEVVTIPWLYNIRRSRQAAFQWLRSHPGQYLIPEDYYTWGDFLWAAWTVIRQAGIPAGRHVFEGTDVTLLVRAFRRHQAIRAGTVRSVGYVRLFRKLKELGFRIDVFVDLFENMAMEKPQVMALATYMPEVISVGFQHYLAPFPLMLNAYTTKQEAERAPHPDVIVCNSAWMAELFSATGYPQEKLRVGPSLRYLQLNDDFPTWHAGDKNTVLVALPIDRGVAAEMMGKLAEAFPTDEGVRFLLKPHPMMTEEEWRWTCGHVQVPAYMTRVEGELREWMPVTACAVVAGGTSSLELVLAAVAVVVVGRDTDFDQNPLEWFPELEGPAHSPLELRERILRKLSLTHEDRARLQEWARQARESCLSPLTDATVGAFVRPPDQFQRSSSIQLA